ncbi:Phosphoglucomutase-2 [Nymphon striatum]|nr:Phosphoglucomutase-2 [Nymphon striatum]
MPVETFSDELKEKIHLWLSLDQNSDTKAEILKLYQDHEVDKLKKLMLNRLAFGTAGLRGVMQAGFNGMNDVVIIQTTLGLLHYMKKVCPDLEQKGVVFGYDARYNSRRFARLSAACFLNSNIPVYLFGDFVPTPFVPFTILEYKCAGGVMVTASHNPKQDNGYKVYWGNGAQIISPHDTGIQANILERENTSLEAVWNENLCDRHELCKDPLNYILSKYLSSLSESVFNKSLNSQTKLKFTYTPIHGVGYRYIKDAAEVCGFNPFIPVTEQIEPDPEFPTVVFPNPEEGKSTLDLSFKTADDCGSNIIIANDPDADRLAIAIKLESGSWRVFTGNEIGGLLGWWLWYTYKQKHPDIDASKVYMISSTVSSKILCDIAKVEGFRFEETLTGFKWMGNRSKELLDKECEVLMAFEEAIGYMCGTRVLDKDGISAAMLVAEMAAHLEKEGKSLYDQLQVIYEKYGYHPCLNSYYLCYCPETIKKMFHRLRNFNGPNAYPSILGEYEVENIRDLTTGYDSSTPNNVPLLPSNSSSEMITFTFKNGVVATLRTSGTEPKVKYYTELCAAPEMSNWKELDETLKDLVSLLIEEWMQPEINNLTAKED